MVIIIIIIIILTEQTLYSPRSIQASHDTIGTRFNEVIKTK